jgi:GNAT superfamily N-acetyltransferase
MAIAFDVVRLEEAQVDQAGRVLGRAFWHDPLVEYILPDTERRARALPAFMTGGARYGHLFGEVYTSSESIEGAAVWMPPGSGEMDEERMTAAGMMEVALAMGDESLNKFFSVMGLLDELRKRDAGDPFWYLFILGVDPPRQGQGVGGRLIAPVLARADEAGLPCYLETMKTRNVPFYRKHGFEIVVEDDFPDGGPHYWTMNREAR